MTTTPRSAASVSALLRARGIRTGYKYTQTGYVDSKGRKYDGPGVMITRQKRARYGGMEDLGAVRVYVLGGPTGERDDPALTAQVVAALADAGITGNPNASGSMVEIPDEQPEERDPVIEEYVLSIRTEVKVAVDPEHLDRIRARLAEAAAETAERNGFVTDVIHSAVVVRKPR